MFARNSWRVDWFRLNVPSIALVTIRAFAFSPAHRGAEGSPDDDAHRPQHALEELGDLAGHVLPWIWSLRAYISTIRGILLSPITLPSGI